jgi:hypothetical protein
MQSVTLHVLLLEPASPTSTKIMVQIKENAFSKQLGDQMVDLYPLKVPIALQYSTRK